MKADIINGLLAAINGGWSLLVRMLRTTVFAGCPCFGYFLY